MVKQTQRNVEIAQLHEEGFTLAAIGERFGLTRERVRQIASGMGCSPRLPQVKERSESAVKQIAKMTRDGKPTSYIAEKLGVTEGYVRRTASVNGITLNRKTLANTRPKLFKRILSKIEQGMPVNKACGGDHNLGAVVCRHLRNSGWTPKYSRHADYTTRHALVKAMWGRKSVEEITEAINAVEKKNISVMAVKAWMNSHGYAPRKI